MGNAERRIDGHDNRFKEHDERINKVELETARNEGFRQGIMSSQK
jgi:hypothetical protein